MQLTSASASNGQQIIFAVLQGNKLRKHNVTLVTYATRQTKNREVWPYVKEIKTAIKVKPKETNANESKITKMLKRH